MKAISPDPEQRVLRLFFAAGEGNNGQNGNECSVFHFVSLISAGTIPRPLGRVFCRVEKAQRFHLAGGYTPSALRGC
jgi:hypothetical protein